MHCCGCKQEKRHSYFYKDGSRKSGYGTLCKECTHSRDTQRVKNGYYRKMSDMKLSNSDFGGARSLVINRDNHKCAKCGMTEEEHIKKWGKKITIHHIDGNGRKVKTKNNDLLNLITLCLKCHGREDSLRRWRNYETKNKSVC